MFFALEGKVTKSTEVAWVRGASDYTAPVVRREDDDGTSVSLAVGAQRCRAGDIRG